MNRLITYKLKNQSLNLVTSIILFLGLMLLSSGCSPIPQEAIQISPVPDIGTPQSGSSQGIFPTPGPGTYQTPIMESGMLQSTPTGFQSQPVNPKIGGQITLWHPYQEGTPEGQSLEALVANAKIAYPNLDLQTVHVPASEIWRDYQIDVIAGGGPDLFIASNEGLLPTAQSGLVQNLDPFFEGKSNQFFPQAIEGMTVDGSLYGAPVSIQTAVIYFNKSQIPIPPQTSDNLLEMLRGGKRLVNIQSAYHLFGWSGAFGGILTDENGRCIADLTGWVGALNYLLELKNAGAVFESDYRDAEEIFLNGGADMLLQGSWEMSRYASYLGEGLGVAALPSGPSGPGSPLLTINGVYLNPNSANKEAAQEVMDYLTGQISQQMFANNGLFLSSRPDIQSGNPLLESVAGGVSFGAAIPQNEGFSNFWLPFDNMFTQVLNGEVSPQQGLNLACTEMNKANNK